MKILILLFLIFSVNANDISRKIKKYMWDEIEVTFLEENNFPTYEIIFYFADGALSDGPLKGRSALTFDLIKSGTNRFFLKEIADNLDYYGASVSGSVLHEYSTFSISGLIKDVVPTIKKVCHLFKDTIYPKLELKKAKKNIIDKKNNLLNNHNILASLAFREIGLENTPFFHPISGKIKTIKKLKSQHLKSKLNYFNQKVRKKIYITGPRESLSIKNIVLKECGWNTNAKFERKVSYKAKRIRKPVIHLVEVPKANQAQIRVGKFLNKGEYENFEKLNFTSHYLGGGFTAILMQELRVKRGLTYSAYASASGQKYYGRSVISTFTKQETVNEVLTILKQILKEQADGKIKQENFKIAKSSLKGGFSFEFESPSHFLKQLVTLDHIGVGYQRFFNYNKVLSGYEISDLGTFIYSLFPYDKLTIVVLGEKSLAKKLKRIGIVKSYSYKKFL